MRLSVTILMTLIVSLCETAWAKSAGPTSRTTLMLEQFKVLDSRVSKKLDLGLNDLHIVVPSKSALQRYDGSYIGPYLLHAKAAARRHGIPEGLFLRLVEQESGWNPNAISTKGALGLAQLMPKTALEMGIDPLEPVANLDGGARYLKTQYLSFGSWRLALAAYNAGPHTVRKYQGVPPFLETQNYIAVILKI